jgi:very-short-patch-repair endonuclease
LRESFPSLKFRRQHPIGQHIVDFACPEVKLVIELDGGQHAEQVEADEERSAALQEHGYRVIRFWNSDVMENLEGVLETISSALGAFPTLYLESGSSGACWLGREGAGGRRPPRPADGARPTSGHNRG